ncbi:3-deoxy-D-manno-octulosonic acid transferase [Ferruginibacter lapsinanis]|uniref:3-deoxy-D-manno-octulosonic acid transferase n=1 Tax=Ferruginibacter lapsinanis TaxID=563172 RepID=UPI001E443F8D|nr:glycosyltransferase N-terminal domain-containing protein [Ferruginibacter lapsinanis]UEG51314.1 3-deoxy-D-manno-octulosonic acid transferase [Ferruginibacter lapsinanis]
MGIFLYNLFVLFYSLGIRIASLWNTKAKLWVNGRKMFPVVKEPISVWMHCASLGEFEQGRPVLEELKRNDPSLKIVLTFFSPSGYEVMKEYKGADHIFYLPSDSPFNAKKFIDNINPSLVLWVKYEYWFYYLHELKKRNIPTLLISGIFLPSQPFFKWYGGLWKRMLSCFNHLFIQDEESKELLSTINVKENITVSGDTRFDRVITIAEKFEPISLIDKFCKDSKVIVAGSTWEEDEAELIHYVRINPNIKFIIASHSIDSENLKDVKKEFKGAVFYSELVLADQQLQSDNLIRSTNILIIDNIGMLSRLYKYADITYVGGGFGDDGVHNVLEAAVYGKPVVFGPEFEKYLEAEELIESEGGITINNALELENVFNKLFSDETEIKKRSECAKNYVYSNAGATKKIVDHIYKNRLLTN